MIKEKDCRYPVPNQPVSKHSHIPLGHKRIASKVVPPEAHQNRRTWHHKRGIHSYGSVLCKYPRLPANND